MPIATSTAERPVERLAVLVKIVVWRNLAERAARLSHQIRLDEEIDVAVQHAVDIADLLLRAMVLDHLVRVQHVTANLAAEGNGALRPADLIELRLLLL